MKVDTVFISLDWIPIGFKSTQFEDFWIQFEWLEFGSGLEVNRRVSKECQSGTDLSLSHEDRMRERERERRSGRKKEFWDHNRWETLLSSSISHFQLSSSLSPFSFFFSSNFLLVERENKCVSTWRKVRCRYEVGFERERGGRKGGEAGLKMREQVCFSLSFFFFFELFLSLWISFLFLPLSLSLSLSESLSPMSWKVASPSLLFPPSLLHLQEEYLWPRESPKEKNSLALSPPLIFSPEREKERRRRKRERERKRKRKKERERKKMEMDDPKPRKPDSPYFFPFSPSFFLSLFLCLTFLTRNVHDLKVSENLHQSFQSFTLSM